MVSVKDQVKFGSRANQTTYANPSLIHIQSQAARQILGHQRQLRVVEAIGTLRDLEFVPSYILLAYLWVTVWKIALSLSNWRRAAASCNGYVVSFFSGSLC